MKQTQYEIDGKKVSYEIAADGYDIYLDGKKYMVQHEPCIPYPALGYEGSCLKQIENMLSLSAVNQEPSLEERNRADIDYIALMLDIDLEGGETDAQ